MAILLTVYSLLVFGIILCFFGKFPGQVLAYAGMLTAAFSLKNHFYPTWLLIVCGVLVVASIIVNKVYAPKLAKKVYDFGKGGRLGTIFGSILSLFFIPAFDNEYVVLVILFVFPYLIAFVCEFISQRNFGEAAKRAGGAYTLFAVSTFINLAISVFCAGQVLFGWIGNGPIFEKITEVASSGEDISNRFEQKEGLSIMDKANALAKKQTAEEKIAKPQKEDTEDVIAKQQKEIEALTAQLESLQSKEEEASNNKGNYVNRKVTYVGKIADKYEITMDLEFVNGIATGSYYYGSGKNGSLQLCGKEKENHLILEERNSKGKITGRFDGILDGLSYYGTFTNLNTGKESEFVVDM